MDELYKLKEENESLKQRIALYESDPVKRGYFALTRIVNQQVDMLNGFNLKTEISSNPKEDKLYDRAKGIWEGLKTLVVDLKTLKAELRISDEDEKKELSKLFRGTTPESVAETIGNTAGKNM